MDTLDYQARESTAHIVQNVRKGLDWTIKKMYKGWTEKRN